jgi:hypothetical protein
MKYIKACKAKHIQVTGFPQKIKIKCSKLSPPKTVKMEEKLPVLRLATMCLLVTLVMIHNAVPLTAAHNGRKGNRTSMFTVITLKCLSFEDNSGRTQ